MTVRAAVVLAGGRSRRMGAEKALLEFGGVTLLERALGTLADHFDSLHVSVARGGASAGVRGAIERFQVGSGRPVGVIGDVLEGVGPVAGIHAALETIDGDRAFFIAVDLPRISVPLIDVLWEEAAREGCLGCVPAIDGFLQPVFAVYSRAFAERIAALVPTGSTSLQGICRRLEGLRIVNLDDPCWRHVVLACAAGSGELPIGALFRNINTPEDYRDLLADSSLDR